MTSLTRRYRFSSSHRLHCAQLSEQENWDTYGKCNNPYGHGHDYVLEVSVAAPVNEQTGRVINPTALDRYVRAKVLEQFDHRDMNQDIPAFAERVPTAENIAAVIRDMLCGGWGAAFPGTRLHRIRIEETRRNSVELRNQ